MDIGPECHFLIPKRRDKDLSDGELHATTTWDWLQDQMFERFPDGGGEDGQPRYGWYRDEKGKRVPDESRHYIVAIPFARVNDLRNLLKEACGVFHQKCIYLCVGGHAEQVYPD